LNCDDVRTFHGQSESELDFEAIHNPRCARDDDQKKALYFRIWHRTKRRNETKGPGSQSKRLGGLADEDTINNYIGTK